MKVTRLSEASAFTPPGHFDMKALPLQRSGPDGHLTLVRSIFLPGGGTEHTCPPAAGSAEMIYYVLDGEITLTTDTQAIFLQAGDSALCGPEDRRSLRNNTNVPATLLIIIGK